MMHWAKIAQVPNAMGCDSRVPPGEMLPSPWARLHWALLQGTAGALLICGTTGKTREEKLV